MSNTNSSDAIRIRNERNAKYPHHDKYINEADSRKRMKDYYKCTPDVDNKKLHLPKYTNDHTKRWYINYDKFISSTKKKKIISNRVSKSNSKSKSNNNDITAAEQKLDASSKRIQNPLCICIGIGNYSGMNNLNTDYDLKVYKRLFQKYGYKVMSNNPNEIWDKAKLKKFLNKCHHELITYNPDTCEYQLNYDAVVITIGGHGGSLSLKMSDGEPFYYNNIRQLFSNPSELVSIPRYYFIDACRTNDRIESISRGTKCAISLHGTLATSEGNSVRGAQICKGIYYVMSANYKKKTFKSFYSIRKQVQDVVEKYTQKQQTINLIEYDGHVDDYTFVPKN